MLQDFVYSQKLLHYSGNEYPKTKNYSTYYAYFLKQKKNKD